MYSQTKQTRTVKQKYDRKQLKRLCDVFLAVTDFV
jgi:hypothetical protein